MVGLGAALAAAGLYAAASALVPPFVGWIAVVIVSVLAGLPAVTLGLVAERERRARGEVERLNEQLKGTLTRLEATQGELLVAERMATVGRLSLKVAHEVRNPISAIELNAEMLQDIVKREAGAEVEEATHLVDAILDQVGTLDALTEEYLAVRALPASRTSRRSPSTTWSRSWRTSCARWPRGRVRRYGSRQITSVPMMEIDRGLLRQAVLNLVKNGMEVLSSGGEITIASRHRDERVEISVSDTGGGIAEDVGRRLFEPFFTTKPQGTGLGLSIARQITEEHGGELTLGQRAEGGARSRLPCP